ncbi:MAG TPA: PadR family transcriptional regulator [Phycisphaerales bacterium]|nr:PadR family transcriptional regulator [Phycisphaerales bacterium]
MPTIERDRSDLLQGTLDMMILKVLAGAGTSGQHGYGIVRRIQQVSDEVLQVEEGSLYPALHRLEKRGCLDSDWRQSESNRRAKYYRLNARGRTQLKTETANWNRLAGAIDKVMNAREELCVVTG